MEGDNLDHLCASAYLALNWMQTVMTDLRLKVCFVTFFPGSNQRSVKWTEKSWSTATTTTANYQP